MKPGDLVRALTPCIFWRERSSPSGHKDFRIHCDEIMTLIDAPWTVQLGRRKETYIRVFHPAHGIIRGFHCYVEVIDEAG